MWKWKTDMRITGGRNNHPIKKEKRQLIDNDYKHNRLTLMDTYLKIFGLLHEK